MSKFRDAYIKRALDAKINSRLDELEKKDVKHNEKITATTRSQQMLLLKYLGLLDLTLKLNTSNKKKSVLLSKLLNSSADNIEGDLSKMNTKSSPLRTSKNYDFLLKTFKDAGLKDLEKTIEDELSLILQEEEKKKSKK